MSVPCAECQETKVTNEGDTCAPCRDGKKPAAQPMPAPKKAGKLSGPAPQIETAYLEQLRMLRKQQKRLKRQIAGKTDAGGNEVDKGYDPKLTTELGKINKMISQLTGEIRKFQKDQEEKLAKMPVAERVDLAARFIIDNAEPAHLRAVAAQLAARVAALTAPPTMEASPT